MKRLLSIVLLVASAGLVFWVQRLNAFETTIQLSCPGHAGNAGANGDNFTTDLDGCYVDQAAAEADLFIKANANIKATTTSRYTCAHCPPPTGPTCAKTASDPVYDAAHCTTSLVSGPNTCPAGKSKYAIHCNQTLKWSVDCAQCP